MKVFQVPEQDIKPCSQGLMIKTKSGFVLLEGKWIRVGENKGSSIDKKTAPLLHYPPHSIKSKSIEDRVEWWLDNGLVGQSSETIAHCLSTKTWDLTGMPSTPRDASDFERCYQLIKLIPEWEHKIDEVSIIYPEWKFLTLNWQELTAKYEAALVERDPRHSERLWRELAWRVRELGQKGQNILEETR